ncbi:MAG: tRNA-dihydrouridine synthase family protein [Phycisphaeraceae bacterium]
MVQIGKLQLDAPFYQAGLAGYSDAAMRLVARRHGAPYAVTEAMLDLFLNNGGKGLAAAELVAEDHPIAGQLMGSFPTDMASAARALVGLGYDVIDVNLACPVKKIRKRSRGGHLMSVPDEAVAILDAVRQAVDPAVPCTVKLRRGSDDSPQAQRDFHRIFEAAIRLGYSGATVHGRTVEQKYLGPSRWAFLRDLVRTYGSGPLSPGERVGVRVPKDEHGIGTQESPPIVGHDISEPLSSSDPLTRPRRLGHPLPKGEGAGFVIGGSGDIWSATDIFRMIEETGVHMVAVARGCIGNPWIFTQARALLAGDTRAGSLPPTIAQQRAVLRAHFDLSVALHGEKQASMMMRKFGIKFSRHHPQAEQVARAYVSVKSLADWHAVIDRHYQHDGPGAAAHMDQASPIETTCAA